MSDQKAPDNVTPIPVWKRNSTAEEFLQEVATVARKYPDRFEKMIVMHEETLPSGRTVVRYATRGASLNELLGLIEIGKRRIIERAESDESA